MVLCFSRLAMRECHLMRIGWLLTTTFAVCLCAEVVLTNDTVLKLVRAGIGEDTIIGMVNQQPGVYALSTADLAALKRAGITEKVIAAMLVRNLAPSSTIFPNNAPSVQPSLSTANSTRSSSDDGISVYVTDSQSWEMRGGWGVRGNSETWGGSGYQSGSAPQTAEMIKTLNQRCPQLTVTNNTQKADFAVLLEHQGGKGYLRRHNKIAVFNRDGDDIFSDSTRALGNSVKDACEAILRQAPHRPSTAHVGTATQAMTNSLVQTPVIASEP